MKIFKSLKSNRQKQHKFIFRILLLHSILTFGAYSFLSYTLNGLPADNMLFTGLKYSRILIVWLPVIYFSTSKIWHLVWNKNKDIILLFISAILSSLFSPNFILTFSYTLWFIGAILSILLYLSVLKKYYENPLLFFLKDLFQVFFIVVLFVIPSLPNLLNKGPEFLYFSSKNFYIYYVTILITIYLINYSHQKIINNKIQIINIFILLFLLFSVFLSGKRVVLIAVILEFLIFVFFPHSLKYKYKSFQKLIAILMILYFSFLVVSNWAFYSSQYSTLTRFDRLINSYSISTGKIEDSSYQERKYIWNQYIDIFKESPIFGSGFLGAQIQLGVGDKDDILSTHSTYICILSDLGLLGILIFIIIFIRRFFSVFKNIGYTQRVIFILLFIPVLLINYSENNLYPGQIFFLYSFLVLLSPLYIFKKSNT